MTTYQNGGRNAAPPDEHRGSWRPQDQPSSQSHAGRSNEDDRDYRSWRDRNYREEEDLYARDPGRWEGSRGSELGYRGDRDGYGRSTERYGQGQRGYSAGSPGDDRAQRTQHRDEPISGSYEDRYQDLDERFARASSYRQDRGYGGGRGFENEQRDFQGPARGGYGYGGYGRDDRMGYLGFQTSGFPGSQRTRDTGWSPSASYGQFHGEPAQRFGDPEAHIHRGTGPHRGKGPVGYQRSDERLREMISEALADDDQLDASNIEVTVKNGEVTLSGSVDDRRAKRDAEDCACTVSGIRDLQNLLRVKDDRPSGRSSLSTSSTSSGPNPRTESEAQDKKHRA